MSARAFGHYVVRFCVRMVTMAEKKEKENLLEQFLEFLKEYKVIGLGLAVVIGGAVQSLSKSLAEDIIMPIVEVLIPGGSWRTMVLSLGPIQLAIGNFLSALIDFIIIALVVFLIYKILLGKKEVSKIK
mgnify:CR=1 FL=1